MAEQSEVQIFLSYSVQDQDRVLLIYDFLTKNGYPNTWIDCKKLLPGQPWEFEIQRNLQKSDIIIFFISNTSVNKRGFVQKELKTALRYLEEKLSNDIYIIPIKLDAEATLPDELTKIQHLDINNPSALNLLKQSLDNQTEKLGFRLSNISLSIDEIHVSKKIFRETWEGLPGYEVEYSFPIFNSTKFENISEVTKLLEASYLKRLHIFRQHKIEQMPSLFSWSQDTFRRTNTFDAHYSSVYHSNCFLSILYTVFWYGAGAAHPNHHFETYNFFLNPLIEINEIQNIFNNSSDAFFQTLIFLVREELKQIPLERDEDGQMVGTEKLLTENWITEGTSTWESLQAFSFSDEGIVFHFRPYQVGPYAKGSHHITIGYENFSSNLTNDLKHALNINYRFL